MAKQKPGYYGILPANVRYDNNLVPMARIMYSEITALANSTGICSASNSYFAKLYDVNRMTVSSWISQLIDGGYIISFVDTGGGNRREIQLPIHEKMDSYIEKDVDPYIEKDVHNNTSNNNISKDIKIVYALYLKGFVIPKLKQTYDDNGDALRAGMKVYKLTPNRVAAIERRLKEFTVKDLCAAVRGYTAAQDGFYVGNGNRGWVADLAQFILKNYESVEKGMGFYANANNGTAVDEWNKL